MSAQLSLLDEKPRRESKSERYRRALSVYRETSREAWLSVQPDLGDVDLRLLRLLILRGGATCDELEVLTGFKHQTVSAQVRHMTEAGLLVASEERRVVRSGRTAIVWRIAGSRRG